MSVHHKTYSFVMPKTKTLFVWNSNYQESYVAQRSPAIIRDLLLLVTIHVIII